MEEKWSESLNFVDLNEAQLARIALVRSLTKNLANKIQGLLPTDGNAGRYRSIAKTKLEEMNWAATKCISRSTEL